MAYPDTTRAVYVGIEDVEGVEAATFYHLHTMGEPQHTLENGIIIPQENTGTRMQDNGEARGKRMSSLKLRAYCRLDEVGIWLTSLLSAPVTAAVVGSTGAYDHVFKGGVARGLSLSIKFFNGLYWRKMLGCRVNGATFQASGTELVMIDLDVLGRASTQISAPTPIAAIETYSVVDIPMVSAKFAGTINADVTAMSVAVANNLSQRATLDGTTSMNRQRFGYFTSEINGSADYPAYSGSLYEAFETRSDPGTFELLMTDDLHEVGTGTPVPVSLSLLLPDPVLVDMSEGSDGGELVQQIRGRAMYNAASAAGIVATLRNDKAASYYDGT